MRSSISWSRSAIRAMAAASAACMAAFTLPAGASQILVRPIQIKITPQARTTSLEIQNLVDVPVRVQISVLEWRQDKAASESLSPTDEVVVFPSIMTVEKGQARSARIGTTLVGVTAEHAYRLVVEELPIPQDPTLASAVIQTGVTIRTKLLIPLFVSPGTGEVKASLDNLAITRSIVHFDLGNAGTVHYTIKKATIHGVDANGTSVFDLPAKVDVVMASSTEGVDTSIPAVDCARVRQITVDIDTSAGPLKRSLPITTSQCR